MATDFLNCLENISQSDVCIQVSPQFEGDIVVYTSVYALQEYLSRQGKNVIVKWPGHKPPRAPKEFPIKEGECGDGYVIEVKPNLVVCGGGKFSYDHTPAELLLGIPQGEDDGILPALFVSIYGGTHGFAVENLSDDVLAWFEHLLEEGFPHYKYVELIYLISSPDVFKVWGEVMKNATLKDGVVVSIYEGERDLLPPEWFRVAYYLGRYTGRGRVYVKRDGYYEYFDADGSRGRVDSL